MPEISVVIPVYNAGKYLNAALMSVKNQTFKDFEVVCINDGSTDNSLDILQSFARDDARFKIYTQQNSGGSVARNVALDKAKGEYIAFLDNDDIYHPQYLETLYKNITEYNADISCCSYLKFVGNNNYCFNNKITEVDGDFVSLQPFVDKFKRKKKIESLMWTKLYRTKLLQNIRFSPQLPAINDILFNIEVLLSARKAVIRKCPLIAYRIINTSQTMQKLSLKRLNEYNDLIKEIVELSKKYPQYDKLLKKIAADYAYGMYVRDVLNKYHPQYEPELFLKIKEDINRLKEEGFLQTNLLSVKKRFALWKFMTFYK